MTTKEMSDIMGIPTRTIGGYERDENPPNEKFLSGLIINFNVNINWLLIGKGAVFIQNEDLIIDKIASNYNISKQDVIDIIKLLQNEYNNCVNNFLHLSS